jgi:hypothetical protein
MRLHCSRVQALFPRDNIRLEHEGPAWMLLTEHGGTLILKVGELQFSEIAAPGEDSGLFLKVELGSPETLAPQIAALAAEQNLTLPPPAPPAPECRVQPILAACHLPGPKKFIFAEDSRLEARPGNDGTAAIAVRGEFRTSPLPCQEGDMVIHLQPRDLAQLLSCFRDWARNVG